MTEVMIEIFDGPRRFAFVAEASTLRRLIPERAIGTYLLLRAGRPVYIGRSDSCLRARLAGHERLGMADHVVWEICRTSIEAFHGESAWFHRLRDSADCLNTVHPAPPVGASATCPFCEPGAAAALEHALRRPGVCIHGAGDADRNGGSPQTTKEERP
jgi:hypothetical protein